MSKFLTYDQFINENFNMSDLFKSAHGAINKKDLQPLSKFIGKTNFPTQEEFDAAVEFLKIDPKFLFYNENDFLHRIIYWKGPVFYGFHGGLNMKALEMFHADKALGQMTTFVEDCIKKKKFESMFHRVEKKILIPTFIDLYDLIPDEQKYDIFTDLYTRSEYGFQMFPIEIIKDVFSKRKFSSDHNDRMKELDGILKLDSSDKITVYRGENSGSSVSDDAFSWTLDRKTAKFFADRFNKGAGKISSKIIDPSEIVDYLPNRGESEVILFPKKFGELKESASDFFKRLVSKPSNRRIRPLKYVHEDTHIAIQDIPKSIVDLDGWWGKDSAPKGTIAQVSETGCKNSEKYVKIVRDDHYVSFNMSDKEFSKYFRELTPLEKTSAKFGI